MAARSYDDIAEWYDEWVRADSLFDGPFFAAVAPLLGETAGRRICDLACGQGRVAQQLAAGGARVVGVDLSGKLLAIAQQYERTAPRGVAYLRDDAQILGAIRDEAFAGVVCHMALMDIADLTATFRAASRVLCPRGWFVFSILHPCYNTPTSGEGTDVRGTISRIVSGYFAEGFWRSDNPDGVRGKIGAYHRTLSTYVNTLTDAGFILERMIEPPATVALAERRPIWREVPAVLVVTCRKGA